jgi:hypothetical protein
MNPPPFFQPRETENSPLAGVLASTDASESVPIRLVGRRFSLFLGIEIAVGIMDASQFVFFNVPVLDPGVFVSLFEHQSPVE